MQLRQVVGRRDEAGGAQLRIASRRVGKQVRDALVHGRAGPRDECLLCTETSALQSNTASPA
ncbi:hypothetical protein [Streptomyces sp. NPDC002676]